MATRRSRPEGNSRAASLPMNGQAAQENQELSDKKIAVRLHQYRSDIQRWSSNLEAVLEGTRMSVPRFVRVVQTSLTQNPDLLECIPSTVFGAILDCATIGLEPGTLLGHAYLLPFRSKRHGNQLVCQLVIGYKGLITLAHRGNPDVINIEAHAVYDNDEFVERRGLRKDLIHHPTEKDRGELRAAYAIARIRGVPDEQSPFEVMYRADILKAAAPAFAGKAISDRPGAWKTHEAEMWRKSAVRKMLKFTPLSGLDVQRAIGIDEAHEVGAAGDRWREQVTTGAALLTSGADRPHIEMPTGQTKPETQTVGARPAES